MNRPLQVRQYLKYMQNIGFGAADILSGTSIMVSRLSDSSYMVDAHACHTVVANILRLSDDPHIGLRIGTATNLNDLGIVGYAMASASTLGQAIGLWLQYGNSPLGFPFSLKLFNDENTKEWGVTAASNGVNGAIYRFHIEEILGMGMRFGQLQTGEKFRLKSAQFSFAEPKHHSTYAEHFACSIQFGAGLTRVIVQHPSLDTPVINNNSELRELCIRHCSQVARQISRHGPVSARLRSVLTTIGNIPSLDSAAEAMKMSPRSLRRHLESENTSFQKVLDEFRCDLAKEYLVNGMMPAKEVAYLLGFSHIEGFRRAFKGWTGRTVGQFVAEQLDKVGNQH